MSRYLKLSEVCLDLDVAEDFLGALCEEGLIEVKHTLEDEPLLSPEEAEKLRVITVLVREMDVNLAGVEVILRMRQELVSMHQQFDEILHALVDELRKRMAG